MKKTFFSSELKQCPGYITKNGYRLNNLDEYTDFNLGLLNQRVNEVMGFSIYDLMDIPFNNLLDDIQ